MLGWNPKTLQMAFRRMEQIPDAEVCPLLGRWIQKPRFCQILGQLACQSAIEKFLLLRNRISCTADISEDERAYTSCLPWKLKADNPWFELLPQKWEQTTIFKGVLFIVVTLVFLCSAPLGVMFLLSF